MKIEGYDILALLVESEKSRVYLGKPAGSDRKVVIKTPVPGPMARASESLLRNEYETTRDWADSPIQSRLLQSTEQGVILVRAFLEGDTLAGWVSGHKPDMAACLRLAIAGASELDALHRRNVIHKNVHPHNLIVHPGGGRITLIDFSVSTRYDLKSPYTAWPAQSEGQLAYYSPEQTGRMNRVVDYRCDLYAFGVVLYELFAGRLPFMATGPLELVHSHLARTPEPPHAFDPLIPPVLSRIILKLLAKNAEDRYQSAACLRVDLETCLRQWNERQTIADFEIARFDVPLRFRIPQKLYGREAERAGLLAAFEKVAAGRKKLVLIGGYSGSGKTALVFDVHIPITEKNGIFIAGKFEQFQRNVPYLAWRQAFDQFTEQLLTQGPSAIGRWRRLITEALGDLTGVITSLLPALEKITGPQPEPPALPATEVQNRFNYAFRSFVRAISTREHPLVIFLDDFQWADAASLNLLRLVMTEPGLGHLLVVGAFRENEVQNGHPFLTCVEELEQEWRTINETDVSSAFSPDHTLISRFSLGNLTEDHLAQLVQDTLDSDKRVTRELAHLLFQKTGGNAYFVHRFLESLHEEGFIRLENQGNTSVWRVDIDQIRSLFVTDNVVDLLARKLEKISDSARRVLDAAACIGHTFDLGTLAVILQKTPAQIETALWQAIDEGLILPLDAGHRFLTAAGEPAAVRFRFAHDRVWQTVHEALPPAERAGIHRRAALLLLQTLPENEQSERIFEIVNHLNEAGAGFDNASLQSRLNYEAGLRAKTSAAYAPAFAFFQKAIACLPADAWENDYTHTLHLHNQMAETAYLSGNDEEMERLIDLVLSKARTTIDKVTALETRVIALFSRQRIRESIALGLEALAMLGVKLPAKPGQAQVALELVKAKMAMRNKTPEQLLQLPLAQQPEHLAVMRIMANLAPPVFFVDTNLYSIILFRLMVFTSRYGIASSSAYAYACYSFVLCAITNEVDTGSRYGDFVVELMKKHPFPEYQSRALFVLYYFVQHWKNPLPGVVSPLKEAYRRSLESGEADFTAFLGNAYAQAAIMSGNDLEELDKELRRQLQYSTQTRHYTSVTFNNIFHQFVLCLRNQAPDPWVLAGEMCDSEAVFEEMTRINNAPVIFNIAYFRAQLALLHGDYDAALRHIEISHGALKSVISIPVYKHHHFLAALIRYHVCLENPALRRRQMARMKADLAALRKYQQYNPGEFSGKLALAEAGFAALHGEHDKALGLFHRALGFFQQERNLYDQGLGSLELFRYARLRGLDDLAATHHRKAADAFRHWGAEAVVQYLQSLPGYSLTASLLDHSGAARGAGREVDLFSIIKGAQVISGELDLQLLVSKMLAVMAENAGATRGALILKKPNGYFVEAEMKEAGTVDKAPSIPYEQYTAAAGSVLNYVLNSGQSIVLDNAGAEGRFVNDPYFREQRVRSLLCMNLLYKNQVVGLLYLENDLVPGAFTASRMEVLQILGTQAAISIENATYYSDIQALNRAYERFVPRVFLQQLGKASITDIGVGDQVAKNMAVMFSDIWGFTTISETVSESEVFALLNNIWARLTPVIEAHGGIVDKFIGDAVLALFPDSVQHCLAAAVEMQRKLLELNAELSLNSAFPVRMGIGVNAGPMILGTVGASSRLDTTVIGDTVNVSARLEDMTRTIGAHIILGSDVVERLTDPARFNLRGVGLLELKGKARRIRLYEEFSNDEPALFQGKKEYRPVFYAFLKAYEAGDMANARPLIEKYLAGVPDDAVGQYYRNLLAS